MMRYETARDIRRRLVVMGTLELLTATSIGGNDPVSLTDQPVLRNYEGIPFIPGTTLAGLLRSHLHEGMGGGPNETKTISNLLGCRWGEDEPQSYLIIEDAQMMSAHQEITELRDGVKIQSETGTAEKNKKFDMEFLPMGTQFSLRFELLLKGDSDNPSEDQKNLESFFWLLRELENSRIFLGARSRRGFGSCTVSDWTYRDFDLSNRDGLLQWLGLERSIPGGWPVAPLLPVPKRRKGYSVINMAEDMGVTIPNWHTGNRIQICLTLRSSGSLLIRSGGHKAGDADAVHLSRIIQNTDVVEPIVSGTSLGGILRHRTFKILNTLSDNLDRDGAKEIVEKLFGPEMGTENGNKETWASRVRTEESVIEENPQTLRHTRVSIDRWRGGSLEHMLLEEDALFGGKVTLKWEALEPTDREIGLMLCLAKDIFTGDLTIGGESSIGRGIFYGLSGTITITRNHADMPHSETIQLVGDGKGSLDVEGDTKRYFLALCQSFSGEVATHAE